MADADLPMKGIQAGHCWVPHTCLTIRHVIDRDSPLHSSNRGKEGICKSRPQEQCADPPLTLPGAGVVTCSVTATDAVSGAPVNAAIAYVSAEVKNSPDVVFGRELRPRLCWDAKFMDMMDFGEIEGEDEAKTMLTYMDNMSRVVSNDGTAQASSTLATAAHVPGQANVTVVNDLEAGELQQAS